MKDLPVPSCTVAGRVVTTAEGSPVRSARIALMSERSGDVRMYATTSDSDGQSVLKDVPPGRYRFFAIRAGFVDQQYRSQTVDGGAVLALKSGQNVSDILFRMTAAAVVTGLVTNENGEPMSLVQVVALRKATEEEMEDEGFFQSRKQELRSVASGQTDDRGQYRIFGLKPGEYYIRATDSFEPDRNVPADESYWVQQFLGTEYAPVYYPGVPQVGEARRFCETGRGSGR
jgi:Carboxypeptidase regulatory-like domain